MSNDGDLDSQKVVQPTLKPGPHLCFKRNLLAAARHHGRDGALHQLAACSARPVAGWTAWSGLSHGCLWLSCLAVCESPSCTAGSCFTDAQERRDRCVHLSLCHHNQQYRSLRLTHTQVSVRLLHRQHRDVAAQRLAAVHLHAREQEGEGVRA